MVDTGVKGGVTPDNPISDARLLTRFEDLYHGVFPSSNAPPCSETLRSPRWLDALSGALSERLLRPKIQFIELLSFSLPLGDSALIGVVGTDADDDGVEAVA